MDLTDIGWITNTIQVKQFLDAILKFLYEALWSLDDMGTQFVWVEKFFKYLKTNTIVVTQYFIVHSKKNLIIYHTTNL